MPFDDQRPHVNLLPQDPDPAPVQRDPVGLGLEGGQAERHAPQLESVDQAAIEVFDLDDGILGKETLRDRKCDPTPGRGADEERRDPGKDDEQDQQPDRDSA